MPEEKVDPNINLPESIRRQIARSHEVHNAMLKGEEIPSDDTPSNVKVIVNGEVAVSNSSAVEEPQPTHPTVKQPEQPPQQPQQVGDDQLTDDERYIKLSTMFNTLKGKYNSEVPQFRARIQELEGKLRTAGEQIIDLNTRLSTKPIENKDLTSTQVRSSITDEEIDQFGEPLVTLIERRAKEIATSLVSAQTAELRSQIDNLGGSVTELGKARLVTEQERREAYLDVHLPDWRVTDADPLFIEWLGDLDAFSGIKRADLLTKAVNAGDLPRIVTIFKGYRTEQEAIGTHTQPNGALPKQPKVRADTLIAPSGGRSEARKPPAQDAPETFTGQQVKDFYQKKSIGKTGMSDAEIADMERRIFLAGNAGRVKSNPRV